MKEYDRVRLIVEKEKYAEDGVHKGMDGWICDPRNIDGQWLVSFDQFGDLPEIACIPVKEEDLEVLADKCSRGRTRKLVGYMELGYEEMLDIYKMAYEA